MSLLISLMVIESLHRTSGHTKYHNKGTMYEVRGRYWLLPGHMGRVVGSDVIENHMPLGGTLDLLPFVKLFDVCDPERGMMRENNATINWVLARVVLGHSYHPAPHVYTVFL